MSERRFVALFAVCIFGIFATFLETLFWAVLGGVVAFAVGLALTDGRERARVARTAMLCALGAAIALVAVSPYLWVALAHPDPLAITGHGYQLDAANLVVPTEVTGFRPPQLRHLATQLSGRNLTEQLGYVGPVLLALVIYAAWERRRESLARVLALTMVAVTVCALGSRLVVAGHDTGLPLPWRLVDWLPLASHALPARAMVIVWLGLALLIALFLAHPTRMRWLLFALAALTVMPVLNGGLWATRLDRPALFQEGRWRAVVRPDENVLTIPFSYEGESMLWQQEAGFGFRLTGGYVTAVLPHALLRRPIVLSFYGAPLPRAPQRALRDLTRDRHVDVVLLRRGWPGPWQSLFRSTFGQPRAVGGMLAWRVRGTWPHAQALPNDTRPLATSRDVGAG
jgi:hypothetical protein